MKLTTPVAAAWLGGVCNCIAVTRNYHLRTATCYFSCRAVQAQEAGPSVWR